MGNKGESRAKRKRGIVDYVLLFFIFCCLVALAAGPVRSCRQKDEMERLRALAERESTQAPSAETEPVTEESTVPETEYVSPINFEELRAVNADVIAWVTVPGTNIDYPVVQAADNETYLKKTFEGGTSVAGSIFLDCDSDSDMMGRHSILYGHHMKNKTMFSDLIKFKDEEFFKQNRDIIIYTPEREIRLKTIAALYGDSDGEKRRTSFKSQETFEAYIDKMTAECPYRDLPEAGTERLYSFVTCSYEFDDARTILYAVPAEE